MCGYGISVARSFSGTRFPLAGCHSAWRTPKTGFLLLPSRSLGLTGQLGQGSLEKSTLSTNTWVRQSPRSQKCGAKARVAERRNWHVAGSRSAHLREADRPADGSRWNCGVQRLYGADDAGSAISFASPCHGSWQAVPLAETNLPGTLADDTLDGRNSSRTTSATLE